MTTRLDKKIIVALDVATEKELWALAEQLEAKDCRLKIGKELFTRFGPPIVSALQDRGFEIFLDLKFHDIPNTVAAACKAAADLGCWMINVHASGGRAMLEAAVASLADRSEKPLLVAVTVLTSLDHNAIREVGLRDTPGEQVQRLAKLALDSALDGVVCSPLEIDLVKESCGAAFLAVTPGVRPASATADDQRRVATPARAIQLGADYLVIGRPITRASDPRAAVDAINAEISSSIANA